MMLAGIGSLTGTPKSVDGKRNAKDAEKNAKGRKETISIRHSTCCENALEHWASSRAASTRRFFLRLGVDAVDFEALRFVEEERLVDAAGEPAIEVGRVVGADDEDVFGCGDAVGVVVDHWLIAVEGEAVVHVALEGGAGAAGELVGGDELDAGGLALDLAGEGARGVVDIELLAVEAEEEDEGGEDGNQGC